MPVPKKETIQNLINEGKAAIYKVVESHSGNLYVGTCEKRGGGVYPCVVAEVNNVWIPMPINRFVPFAKLIIELYINDKAVLKEVSELVDVRARKPPAEVVE